MREPLSDEDVKRIARETARELVKQAARVGVVIVVSLVALMLLPVVIVTTVNAFAPPLGQSSNPLAVLPALAFLLLIFVLVRSWTTLRHR